MSLFGFPEGLAGGSKETEYLSDFTTTYGTDYTTNHITDVTTNYSTSVLTSNVQTVWNTSNWTAYPHTVSSPYPAGSIWVRFYRSTHALRKAIIKVPLYNWDGTFTQNPPATQEWTYWNNAEENQDRNNGWYYLQQNNIYNAQPYQGIAWQFKVGSGASYITTNGAYYEKYIRISMINQPRANGTLSTSRTTSKNTDYPTSHITDVTTAYSTEYATDRTTDIQTSHITYG